MSSADPSAALRAHLLDLFAYTDWANRTVLDALAAAPDDLKEGPALDLFSHVLRAQLIWLDRVRGRTPELAVWARDDLAVCAERLEVGTQGWTDVVRTRDLAEPIAYANTKGRRFTNTVAEIAAHVVNHGTHHRGQILRLFRDAGRTPPLLDLIFYLRER